MKLKKYLSFLIAVIMAFGVATTAFADVNHSITITNGYATDENGNQITEAAAGQIVTIVAEDKTGLREFNWWRYYGDTVEFADDEAETTTFVMPDCAVVIDAFFSNILVEEANFTIENYFVGEDVASLSALASTGIEILPIDGYAGNCVLFADNDGVLSDVAVEGNVEADTHYWIGIRFRAAEAYDICELMPENVSLADSLEMIYSTNEDYENLEAIVYFRLPKAIEKPEGQVDIIESVEVFDVTVPAKGEKPDFDVLIPESADYSVQDVSWKRLENTETQSAYAILNRDDVFQSGNDYQIDVILQANDGYEFKVNEDGNNIATAKLNNEPAMTGSAYGNETAKEFLCVSYVYTIVDEKIHYVSVSIETVTRLETYEDVEVIFISVADPSIKYTFKTTLKTTDDGKTTLDTGKTTLDTGKTTLDDGKTTLDDGKTTLDTGKTTLDDGKTTLDDGKTTLDDGKTTLDDGKTTEDGKTTLDTGKTTLDFYLKTTKTTDGFLKTTDIPEGEYIVKTTKPGFVAVDFKTTLKTTMPANLKTTLHMYGDNNSNGKIDSMDYLYLKRAYFQQYKLDLLVVSDLNLNGSIDGMDYLYLKRANFGQFKLTDIGKTTLDDGKTTLDDGKTTLDDGKTTLDTGKTTLDTGKTTLDINKTIR